MRRTEMSRRELRKVEVLARVKSRELQELDAAALLRSSCRQARRLWKRHREEGAAGMKYRRVAHALISMYALLIFKS